MQKLYLVAFILFSFVGYCPNAKSQSAPRQKEIICDKSFKGGIVVQGAYSSSPTPITVLHPYGDNNTTSWYLPQWGSKHVLSDSTPKICNDTIIYENNAKRISLYKSIDESIIVGLEVFASNEYDCSRQLNQDWVHLLLEQKFSDFVYLNDVNQLQYTLKARLMYCENKMGKFFNPDLHTAQITHFFTIQNKNESSPDFGDFFWFGLSLYDFRYRNIEQYAAKDLGKDDASNKFIFSVASEKLFQNSMHDFNWISIEKDILPHIVDAFDMAQKKGYLQNSLFEDLCITSTNIGWEVPGTFDCGFLFETPSLKAFLK